MIPHIHNIIDKFFTIKAIGNGAHGYYFKDSSVTTDRFGIYMNDCQKKQTETVYHISLHSVDKNASFDNSKVFTFNIEIDNNTGKVSGQMIMNDDYKLSEDTCMVFFNMNLNVGYVSAIGQPIKNHYYDRDSITRLRTIKSILDHS